MACVDVLGKRGYWTATSAPSDKARGIAYLRESLPAYHIAPEPYVKVFTQLAGRDVHQVLRFICNKWFLVREKLQDHPFTIGDKKDFADRCMAFFLASGIDHRVFFFIEMVYDFFFPSM